MTERSFKEFFHGHRYEFENMLDLSNGIVKKMLDKNILTDRQYATVESGTTKYEKIDKMISILERRPTERVPTFCDLLIEDEQKEIVEKFYPEYIVRLSEREQHNFEKKRKVLAESNDEYPGPKHLKVTYLADIDDECDFPEIQNVKVKRTTIDFYQQQSAKAYALSSACRGTVCIISVMKTHGMLSRRGTDVDCQNLKTLFLQMHFRVLAYNDDDDLTAEGIIDKVKDASSEVGDCFMLFILSHGGIEESSKEEVFYGTDGKSVPKKRVLEDLKDQNCPHLKGKPRIVFFQSCRGSVEGLTEETDGPAAMTQSHFLVCYPCEPEFMSYRHPRLGSRYIRCLVNIFMTEAHNASILSLMTMVNDRLNKFVKGDKRHQVATFSSSLRKEFYFFPGIVEGVLE